MNYFNIIAIGLALFIFIVARMRWALWKIEDYKINALWFCCATNQSKDIVKEMSQIYPIGYIIFEAWNWDFRKYVVYQGLYDEMMEFIEMELEKDELKLDTKAIEEKNKVEGFND